ncbi:hypothetical protein [Microbacterium sp. YY-01]
MPRTSLLGVSLARDIADAPRHSNTGHSSTTRGTTARSALPWVHA